MKESKYIRNLKNEVKRLLEAVDGNTKDGEYIVEFLYGAISGFHRRKEVWNNEQGNVKRGYSIETISQ